jgi:hypothetical protein
MAQAEKILKEIMSLKKCKEVLNKNGNKFSDQQIIEIRDLLCLLAGIDYAVFIYNEKKNVQQSDDQNPEQKQAA